MNAEKFRNWPARLFLVWALVILAVLLRTQFQLAMAVGNSMEPTLRNGELLIVRKAAYRTAEPHRGDIVVARYRSELVVKRIVGLPHEEVEVREGRLYINRVPQREDHLVKPGVLNISKGVLCDGRFALLGDNRAISIEASVHGIVGKEDIVGRVVLSLGAPGRANLQR